MMSSGRVSFCCPAAYWFPLQHVGSLDFLLLRCSIECLLGCGSPTNRSPFEGVPAPAWVTPTPESLRVVPLHECISSRSWLLISLNLLEQGCHMPPQSKEPAGKFLVVCHSASLRDVCGVGRLEHQFSNVPSALKLTTCEVL